MAKTLGTHSDRVAGVRALLGSKGRREQRRFAFEGPTLLAEARRSGIAVAEIFATASALRDNDDVVEMERRGSGVYTVDDRTAAKISDLKTPTGLVCVAPIVMRPIEALLHDARLTIVLAGISDPGNAGTLLRSAEAFGASGAVFGRDGVDPYHPKVIRAAMGTIFRLPLTVADPEAFGRAAAGAGLCVLGLDATGDALSAERWIEPTALIVGHERRGLGPWGALCARHVVIPMPGAAESLNAAIAGSIALYESSKRNLR